MLRSSLNLFLKLVSYGLILFGLSGVFLNHSSFVETEDYFYIGIFLLFLSSLFKQENTKDYQLPVIFPDDPIFKNELIWEPIANESSSFKSQKLVDRRNGIIEIRTTASVLLFHILFIFIGLFAWLISAVLLLVLDAPEYFSALIPGLVGGLFLWFGFSEILPKKIATFNFNRQQFTLEQDRQDDKLQPLRAPYILFSQIQGLQLIEVFHPSRNHYRLGTLGNGRRRHSSSFYSYELNLILKNNERVNVMSYGDKADIVSNAKRLAERLSVPLWHRL